MSQELENVFINLVETSWERFNEEIYNRRIDDLLIGGVVVAMVEDGSALIDLSSDGVSHYLRFEHMEEKHRLIFRLTNLSENLTTAKVLGHRANVIIGYGEPVKDAAKLWQTLKSEVKSSFLVNDEPGVITTDADIGAGYIYAQVPLILDLDPYFDEHYDIDYVMLRSHINATVHSLKKYLQGRLQTDTKG